MTGAELYVVLGIIFGLIFLALLGMRIRDRHRNLSSAIKKAEHGKRKRR